MFVCRQPAVKNGDIAAVSLDNEITLRRLYHHGEAVLLAENLNYPPISFMSGEAAPSQILGKAVAFQSCLY